MSIWNIFTLFGGLTIFLFGMMEMNKHLTAIAGTKMKGIMLALTRGGREDILPGRGTPL